MPDARPPLAAIPSLDRRTLMKSGLVTAGVFAMPGAVALARGGLGFTHGVASGEPSATSVLLWTRYAAEQDTSLEWQVATGADFTRVIAEGRTTAAPSRDFCVKADATGLEPGTWYYYRFLAPDGSVSDIGRTKTLPEGRAERFRLAVFSCSNIGFGWFNAYAAAVEANDADCVYHAGDYFYEYPVGTYPSVEQLHPARAAYDPVHETISLADYRLRFAMYRRDPDLRRLHQLYPMIAGWDDHESTNDSWQGGAQNHDASEGDWGVRKRAAMQAYREWMPVSDADYATYAIGDLATLYRLETRLSGRDEPPSLSAVLRGKASAEEAQAALVAFRDGAYADPTREVLGTTQQAWLADGLTASVRGGTRWQVLLQQVLMGSLSTPASLADALTDETPDFVRERVRSGALAGQAGLPLNMDAWDGYPAARARVFAAAQEAQANLVVLAGDTHNSWAFDLSRDGAPVGVEFGGPSVSSPGFENFLPQIDPQTLGRAVVENNPQLRWADTARRGYMALELTRDEAACEYRFSAPVATRSDAVTDTHVERVAHGSNRLA